VLVVVAVLTLAAAAPRAAHAFCGFYVGGADAKLFNGATQVVLMRDGLRTVLSMQNDYQGPPDAFALVVPVPVVLQKENVRTLPKEVFDRVDKLTAPRLVEYWEQDPCKEPELPEGILLSGSQRIVVQSNSVSLGVTVEAKFTVGEYDIVVLSAKDSTGLDTWLRREKYKIPEGAEPYLRPYVQNGSKFFVAKVDPKKVTIVNGHAALSPLRFHYDANDFALPIRLGLINSGGTQDLIVHVLAPNQRYEPANYPSVTIPTNLDLSEEAGPQFGAMYAALFDRTIAQNPGAVVTEYAWDASSCDPCPGPALQPGDFATLGADVVPGQGPPVVRVEPVPPSGASLDPSAWPVAGQVQGCWSHVVALKPQTKGGRLDVKLSPIPMASALKATVVRNETGDADLARCVKRSIEEMTIGTVVSETVVALKVSDSPQPRLSGWTITRLHARYTKDSLGQDIVFRPAPPITGGREVQVRGPTGDLQHGAQPAASNNFQGRYAIRHPWTGPMTCANPRRGVWGGPPGGMRGSTGPRAATDLAFVPRGGVDLPALLRSDVPELGLTGLARPLAEVSPAVNASDASSDAPSSPPVADASAPPGPPPEPRGCHGCATGGQGEAAAPAALVAALLGAAFGVRRRRR
jgi:MYXO-CTERM domain-containing protein